MFDLGWSLSGFALLARAVVWPGPYYVMGKYFNGFDWEILTSADPDQPNSNFNFGGLITPDMRFPYGLNVEPD